jgi:hypothetical protein
LTIQRTKYAAEARRSGHAQRNPNAFPSTPLVEKRSRLSCPGIEARHGPRPADRERNSSAFRALEDHDREQRDEEAQREGVPRHVQRESDGEVERQVDPGRLRARGPKRDNAEISSCRPDRARIPIT